MRRGFAQHDNPRRSTDVIGVDRELVFEVAVAVSAGGVLLGRFLNATAAACPIRFNPLMRRRAQNEPAFELLPRRKSAIDKKLHVIASQQSAGGVHRPDPKSAEHRFVRQAQPQAMRQFHAVLGKRNRCVSVAEPIVSPA